MTFFLVEMGDKTQIATAALAAKYHVLIPVVAGTVLGMMIADVPVVLLGEVAARKIPLKLVHRIAAVAFFVLGVLVVAGRADLASRARRTAARARFTLRRAPGRRSRSARFRRSA